MSTVLTHLPARDIVAVLEAAIEARILILAEAEHEPDPDRDRATIPVVAGAVLLFGGSFVGQGRAQAPTRRSS